MNTVGYETFVCSGEIKGVAEGQPAIIRYPEIVVETPATMFLYDRYVRAGNRPSPNTWRSAADAITSWLTFCQAAGIAVESADEEDLRTYRDEYLRAVSRRGVTYSPKTVAMRMSYIQEYCDYLADCGLYTGDISAAALKRGRKNRIDERPLAHIGSAQSSALTPSSIKPKLFQSDAIQPASPRDLQALMHWAERSSAPERNALIFKIGWVCGLRKSEALRLKCPQMRGLVTDPDGPNIPHRIAIIGKGRKERNVAVPAWLINEINTYIDGERTNAMAKRRNKRHPAYLFVGSSHSKTSGKPLTPSAIDALMKRACMETGLVDTTDYENPETGERQLLSRRRYSY